MLRPSFTNDAMRTLIHQLQTDWHPEWGDPAAWHAELTWSLTADIDRLVARIRDRYAIDRGRPAHDPATLFRFLGLLTVREVASLVDGLQQVRQSPLLARLCGWSTPDAIPAIGTIYGFLRRLVPEARPRQGAWRRPSGRRLTLKAGQKMPPRRPGAVARVARRVLREAQRGRRPARPSDLWDRLLATTAVESVHRQVLPAAWHLAPDGSPIDSGAYSFGHKRCACPSKRCTCLRWFSDPMALLGWDSHRHRYFFGYMPLAMAVVNGRPDDTSHPLLVSLALHPGNRNDAVAYPDLVVKTQTLYAAEDPSIRVTHMIGDAAFDVHDLWTFTRARGIVPVFAPTRPVEPAHLSPAALAAGIHLDAQNRPQCQAGQDLVCLGQKRLGVTVYACPLRQRRHAECDQPCAKARKTVTINDRGSRYAESGVPYGTPIWSRLYAERTGVERAFSLWTQDGIKRAHHRRPYLWLGRLAMGAIVAHHQAWSRHAAA